MPRRLVLTLAIALLTCAASPATLPARKPGFWQTTMTMSGITLHGHPYKPPAGQARAGQASVTAICLDPATDLKQLRRAAAPTSETGGTLCPAPTITGTAPNFTIAQTCKTPDGAVTTITGTLVYDGDTATRLTEHTISPAMSATVRLDSKWIGPCPAGIAPGESGLLIKGKFQPLSTLDAPPK